MMDVVISQERGWNMDIDNKLESFSQQEKNVSDGSNKISYPSDSNITVSKCYKYQEKNKIYIYIKFTKN